MSTVTSIHGRRLGVEVGTDDLVIKGSQVKRTDGTPVTTRLPVHTVANAPSAAAAGVGAVIFVSNGNGGAATIAVSNGTNWLDADGDTISAS